MIERSRVRVLAGAAGEFFSPGSTVISVFVPYHWGELPQVPFLSRQKFCRDKHVFVATKHVCVPRKYLSRQAYFCRDKKRVCRDKSKLVVTKLLSRQKYICIRTHTQKDVFCRDKLVFVANFCRNTCLSRQKVYLWQIQPMTFPPTCYRSST